MISWLFARVIKRFSISGCFLFPSHNTIQRGYISRTFHLSLISLQSFTHAHAASTSYHEHWISDRDEKKWVLSCFKKQGKGKVFHAKRKALIRDDKNKEKTNGSTFPHFHIVFYLKQILKEWEGNLHKVSLTRRR